MSLHNEPILTLAVASSIYYFVSLALNTMVTYETKATSWGDAATTLRVKMGIHIVLKFFVIFFYMFVCGYASQFVVNMNPVVTNSTFTELETVSTPIYRAKYKFAELWFTVVWFILTYAGGVALGMDSGKVKIIPPSERYTLLPAGGGGASGGAGDLKITTPLGYDSAVFERLWDGRTFPRVSTHYTTHLFHWAGLAGVIIFNFLFFIGVYKEQNYRPAWRHWMYMGTFAMFFQLALLVIRMFGITMSGNGRKETEFMAMPIMTRYGEIFNTNYKGMHLLWFLPHWTISSLITWELATQLELNNDYLRFFVMAVLNTVIPVVLSMATGSMASFYYFYLSAKAFSLVLYWIVAVPFPNFSPADIYDGIPTGSGRRWWFFFWDWANTNFQYTVDGTLGIRYFLGSVLLAFTFVGAIQTLMEVKTFRERGFTGDRFVLKLQD